MKKMVCFFLMGLLLVSLIAGCSSSDQPGKVTINGTAVKMPYAFGLIEKKIDGYMVELFNHDKVKSEDLLSGDWRTVADGEINFRVHADKNEHLSSVGIGGYIKLGVRVKILKKPVKVGDSLVLQIPDKLVFTPTRGEYKGKKITVQGVFKATVCGIRK